jgi:hypothetical protein
VLLEHSFEVLIKCRPVLSRPCVVQELQRIHALFACGAYSHCDTGVLLVLQDQQPTVQHDRHEYSTGLRLCQCQWLSGSRQDGSKLSAGYAPAQLHSSCVPVRLPRQQMYCHAGDAAALHVTVVKLSSGTLLVPWCTVCQGGSVVS